MQLQGSYLLRYTCLHIFMVVQTDWATPIESSADLGSRAHVPQGKLQFTKAHLPLSTNLVPSRCVALHLP